MNCWGALTKVELQGSIHQSWNSAIFDFEKFIRFCFTMIFYAQLVFSVYRFFWKNGSVQSSAMPVKRSVAAVWTCQCLNANVWTCWGLNKSFKNTCVWTYENGPRVIRLDLESDTNILDEYLLKYYFCNLVGKVVSSRKVKVSGLVLLNPLFTLFRLFLS